MTLARHTVPVIVLASILCGCNLVGSRTYDGLGRIQYRRGNYTAARFDFQRAVLEEPRNANYWHNLASAMKKQGDLAAAEQMYRRALLLNPAHQPAYHGLAETLHIQGRSAEALALLVGWKVTQPYTAKPFIEVAWLKQELGDYAGAELELQQALRVQPSHPIALAQLGQVYQRTGRAQAAVAMYQRSLYAHWNQPQVQSRLASLRPATRRYGFGSAASRSAIAFTPRATVRFATVPAAVSWRQPTTSAAFRSTVVAPGRLATAPPFDADPAHDGEPTRELPAGAFY